MVLSGYADLPLHDGHVPPWLANLMRRLARAIIKVLIIEFKNEGLLRRLANPLWFQAFNNAIGMDWDSSGSTTVTTAILKEVLNELNLDVRVAGGKGAAALKTPDEILKYGDELNISTAQLRSLINTSKTSAKIDTVLLQDGFTLYHHAVIFDRDGRWVVIQQGMNTEVKLARRYHIAWFSINVSDVSEEPHSGISSDYIGLVLNLTDRESRRCKNVIIDLMKESPRKVFNAVAEVNRILKGVGTLGSYAGIEVRRNIRRDIPYYKPVRLTDKLLEKLRKAYEAQPSSINEALAIPGVGSEVYRALSLIAELVYREPPSLRDPVTHPYDPFKYSFVVGGKDGVPFPIKRELMINVIKELEEVVENAELGRREKLMILRSLAKYAPQDVNY